MKIRILSMLFIASVMVLILPITVKAAGTITIEGSPTTYNSLSDALAAATDGNKLLLSAGDFTIGATTIDKAISIKGSGKDKTTLTGNLIVAKNLNLENLSIVNTAKSIKAVDVTALISLNIINTKIDNKVGEQAALRVSWTGEGSTLNITGSDLIGKYAFVVRSQKVTALIDNCNLSGYAAIDVATSNSLHNGDLSLNNNITVKNSTLIGLNNYTTHADNSYGVVVIGGQNGGQFNFDNVNVSNSVSTTTGLGNQENLILLNGDYYLPNKNSNIVITNSKLENTDNLYNSFVFATGNLTVADNKLTTKNNTIIAPTNTIYEPIKTLNEVSGYIVTFKDFDGNITIKTVNAGQTVAEVTPLTVKDYIFNGWYNGENKFDFNTRITSNLSLESKYTKNVPIAKIEVANPNTGDDIVNYGIIGLIGLMGIALTSYCLRKKIVTEI
ncbi:MAG: InlB B-repeat-containing protein [Bacilli bacterium]